LILYNFFTSFSIDIFLLLIIAIVLIYVFLFLFSIFTRSNNHPGRRTPKSPKTPPHRIQHRFRQVPLASKPKKIWTIADLPQEESENQNSLRLQKPECENHHCESAQRKPILKCPPTETSLMRLATRRRYSSLSHEPPRRTRFPSASGSSRPSLAL